MNEIKQIQKDLSKITRRYQRGKTYFALIASHCFDKAVLSAQCAKPTSLDEAQKTSNLINFLWQAETTPYEFMKPIDETVNESIKEYENFQKAVSICPYDKRILDSFAHWYAHSGFEVAMLKCNIGYIIHFGLAIQERNVGKITETEMLQTFSNIINAGDDLFTFHPGRIMRTFTKAVAKFEEIEQKIETRQSGNTERVKELS